MAWLRVTMEVDRGTMSEAEARLNEIGAIAVTLENAGDGRPGRDRLFDAEDPESVEWSVVRISGLFEEETDLESLLAARGGVSYVVEAVPDQVWERTWMEAFEPVRVTDGLWICPSWLTPPDPAAVSVILDPGLAFGTGRHESTALCLEWLAEQELDDATVIDYGCGSGILGIAALKLGAARAIATDIDADALVATRENGRVNGYDASRLLVVAPDAARRQEADIVLANILAKPLVDLAPVLCALTRRDGRLVLAGLLDAQEREVRAAYASEVAFGSSRARDRWRLLVGTRRNADGP